MPGQPLRPPNVAPGAPSVQGSPTRGTEGAQASRTWVHDTCPLTPAQRPLAAAMTEDTGRNSVEWHLREYLKEFRLKLAYHPWRQHARRAREGWPDWAITGRGGFIVRENKRQGEDPEEAQEEWLDSLQAAGVDVGVWKPCCVLSGRMARELAAVAGIGAA
jgi:hypothetical protein